MRILLIEDDEEAAAFLAKGLKECGFVVDHAANGPDGLHLATTEPYSAMIVDRMLPGMDGLNIVELLAEGGQRHAGADPQRHGPGRRPGQGPPRRR